MGDPFDIEFVKLLVCPKCKRPIEVAPSKSGFVCRNCKLLYKVENGIPIFLIEKAQPLEEPNANS